MRTSIILACLAGFAALAQAVFVFIPMKDAPPKAEDIGEIMFDRTDTSINNSEYVTIPRETFLRFFSEGEFSVTHTNKREVEKKMGAERNKRGGDIFCTGHFATKGGKIYGFHRYNSRVMEIEDVGHRMGWLVLPE